MRVVCRHGHLAFYPRRVGDIYQFAQSFNVELVREEDYFTFSDLAGAPNYSITGKNYLNIPAIATYAGKPWEVMRENNLVYNIDLGLLVPKESIVGVIELSQKSCFYVCNVPMIQPGARSALGRQITSYSGEFTDEKFYLRVLEFEYD